MRNWIAGLASAAACVAGFQPVPAEACGGFFCGGVPMVQSGENIIFAMQSGQMEAHVYIQYTGAADQFAWVVPVHSLPTLSIGSPSFFQAVAQSTQPEYYVQYQENSSCSNFGRFGGGVDLANAPGAQTGGNTYAPPQVNVISTSQVGPFDSAILQATDVTALEQWLQTNGYNLTTQGGAALAPYVGQGYYFVALKLQQNEGTGDIRPIVLSFAATQPCIPIRLTAIAATPNMPVTAFVFSNTRAVPTNFREVVINETKIDWLGYGSNYSTLAAAAIGEAGGHAFLTEFAGATDTVIPASSIPGDSFNTQKLSTITDPVDFLLEMLAEGFPRDPSIQDMLLKYVPEPQSLVQQGVTTAQFYNQISTYRDAIANDPGRAPFDPVSFANDLQTIIVAPLMHAKDIVTNYPYLTRLATSLSPELMTLDPEFDYNPGLGDVSHVHMATATPICDFTGDETAVKVVLPDGRTLIETPGAGPLDQGPNAEFVEQLSAVGPPEMITDNSAIINRLVAPRGCNCGTGLEPLGLLALLALQGLRRRRTP
jgi:hypothetical protein